VTQSCALEQKTMRNLKSSYIGALRTKSLSRSSRIARVMAHGDSPEAALKTSRKRCVLDRPARQFGDPVPAQRASVDVA